MRYKDELRIAGVTALFCCAMLMITAVVPKDTTVAKAWKTFKEAPETAADAEAQAQSEAEDAGFTVYTEDSNYDYEDNSYDDSGSDDTSTDTSDSDSSGSDSSGDTTYDPSYDDSTTDNTEDNVIEDDSSSDYDTSDTDTSDSDDGTEDDTELDYPTEEETFPSDYADTGDYTGTDVYTDNNWQWFWRQQRGCWEIDSSKAGRVWLTTSHTLPEIYLKKDG